MVRSNSDTDMFFDKENLDIIHTNLKNFKHTKFLDKKGLTAEKSKSKLVKKESTKLALLNRKLYY